MCVGTSLVVERVTVEIVAWEGAVQTCPENPAKAPALETDDYGCCAERFNSDVAQWIACRAHRHSPLPGGSSIETRRRYFLFYFIFSQSRQSSLFLD